MYSTYNAVILLRVWEWPEVVADIKFKYMVVSVHVLVHLACELVCLPAWEASW